MRKKYEAPEVEVVRLVLTNILSTSREDPVSSQITGDDDFIDDEL